MNKETFKAVYRAKLVEAVQKFPEQYCWPVENAPVVAERMFEALDRGSANVDSKAFKLTAKALGIKSTRTAIFGYWNAPVAA